MKLKETYIKLDTDKRIIFISDIHGNLNVFKRLLNKVKYCSDDYLFILGDIIEKGNNSLETLQYIYNMAKHPNVFVVMGNCDALLVHIYERNDNQSIVKYLFDRSWNSIIREFCTKKNIAVSENMDIDFIIEQFNKEYEKEINFIFNLPHIIKTDFFTVVHAGIKNHKVDDAYEVMKYDNFIADDCSFDKWVIVGHMPTVNYHRNIGNCNPYILFERKIISIDGGNVIKESGQLNAFMINNLKDMKFSYTYVDDLKYCRVLEDQTIENQDPINIWWGANEIEVISETVDFYHVRHLETNHELNIPKQWVFCRDGRCYCFDSTDYYLNVKKGETVGIIYITKDLVLAKHDGIFGWIESSKVDLKEENHGNS